ncbi:MAG TPA: XdhC/CoxI family protein [Gemmatimonadaceae bacterium]|jgi:xanthine dehydrogenase accessory factor
MNGLIPSLGDELRNEDTIVVATLVAATGTSSKKVGARMYVGQSGKLIGGVTIGGCVDAQVIEAADALIERGGRKLLSISLDDDEAWEIGLTCGGTVDVLIERARLSDPSDPVVSAHRQAATQLDAGEIAELTTTLDDGRTFVDRISPPTTLLIIGAGEIATSLTRMARELEMRAIVIDGRDRYATRERFPDADEIRVGMPSEIVAEYRVTPRFAAILVAHDYKYELPVLRALIRSRVGYIGMLGSKKRSAAVRDLLKDEGFTDDELARVRTPIGLDIGGKAPAEVALSILAEVVAVRSGKVANAQRV